MEPYGVVFSGGGALGSWEVGCYKAILQKHSQTPPMVVTGASAGALNAACIFLGMSIEELRDLWVNIDRSSIHKVNIKGIFFGLFNSGIIFLKTKNFSNSLYEGFADFGGIFDTSPLRRLLYRNLKLQRANFPSQSMAFAATLTNLKNQSKQICYKSPYNFKSPTDEWIEIINMQNLIDVLIGTTAIPGLYPPVGNYVDGGVLRNQPIGPAVLMLEAFMKNMIYDTATVYVCIPSIAGKSSGKDRSKFLNFGDRLSSTIDTWLSLSLDWQVEITKHRNTIWTLMELTDAKPNYNKIRLCVIRPRTNLDEVIKEVGLLGFGKKVNDLIASGFDAAKSRLDSFNESDPETWY